MRIPSLAKDRKYHSQGGYQTVNQIPFHTKCATAFVNAGSELGYPVVDINGPTQVGFSFHQVNILKTKFYYFLQAMNYDDKIEITKYFLKNLSIVFRHFIWARTLSGDLKFQ